jgi:hypothetical protein
MMNQMNRQDLPSENPGEKNNLPLVLDLTMGNVHYSASRTV